MKNKVKNQKIKWDVEIYPILQNYIVAPNMKFYKASTILNPSMTRRITKMLMGVA